MAQNSFITSFITNLENIDDNYKDEIEDHEDFLRNEKIRLEEISKNYLRLNAFKGIDNDLDIIIEALLMNHEDFGIGMKSLAMGPNVYDLQSLVGDSFEQLIKALKRTTEKTNEIIKIMNKMSNYVNYLESELKIKSFEYYKQCDELLYYVNEYKKEHKKNIYASLHEFKSEYCDLFEEIYVARANYFKQLVPYIDPKTQAANKKVRKFMLNVMKNKYSLDDTLLEKFKKFQLIWSVADEERNKQEEIKKLLIERNNMLVEYANDRIKELKDCYALLEEKNKLIMMQGNQIKYLKEENQKLKKNIETVERETTSDYIEMNTNLGSYINFRYFNPAAFRYKANNKTLFNRYSFGQMIRLNSFFKIVNWIDFRKVINNEEPISILTKMQKVFLFHLKMCRNGYRRFIDHLRNFLEEAGDLRLVGKVIVELKNETKE